MAAAVAPEYSKEDLSENWAQFVESAAEAGRYLRQFMPGTRTLKLEARLIHTTADLNGISPCDVQMVVLHRRAWVAQMAKLEA